MKEVWVQLHDWDKEVVTAAVEAGADGVVAPPGVADRVRRLSRVLVVAEDGDWIPGRDVHFVTLKSPEDERRISDLLKSGQRVVVENADWEIIPLENLVAGGGALVVAADDEKRMELALGVLEKGVQGVLIPGDDPATVSVWTRKVKAMGPAEKLVEAEVVRVEPVGLGDRVCIDTCSLLTGGQGALVGNSAGFLFLVHAETRQNPYVAPRPFRVNAGAVHAYVKVPEGRTRYLCELEAGDPVVVVDTSGKTSEAVVGRIKVERRPLVVVEARCEAGAGSILLQNAETVCLTSPQGDGLSVTSLEKGVRVLVSLQSGGRHFGLAVDESIMEK
ncbi:3-dehydroquinate synthase II [Desulfacinum hydrothermale DSM 13146]|uniref:3-dehydroquinate synthase II n=1 Tax=Desulfacinum hydrothermale DSM 13146 TaxID=1121390 RepID=A0A1W1XFN4_9BACT|nr:3-dehydroquinate synthase II [Desulfacinum hydrothermale]SMC22776.1 3-dehydroquinate synthase II [Desulfacinum hydrothermale DSM 13146]